MARVNRFSETIAELLPMLLPSIDKLLIWEHKAKEKEQTCVLGNAVLLGLLVGLLQQQQSSNNSTIKIQLPHGRILAF